VPPPYDIVILVRRGGIERVAIFISYRRDDTRGYAGRLHEHLSRYFRAKNVFMDVVNIAPGTNFDEVLSNTLDSCGALIVLIGKQWLTQTDAQGQRRLDDPQDRVRLEIATALKRKIFVVPALVGGAQMPASHQLPENIADLANHNAVEISDVLFGASTAHLIKVLQQGLPPYSQVPVVRKIFLLYTPRGNALYVFGGLLFRGVMYIAMVLFTVLLVTIVNDHPGYRTYLGFTLLFEFPLLVVVVLARTAGFWCDRRAVRLNKTQFDV
jgi:hypothetical protein